MNTKIVFAVLTLAMLAIGCAQSPTAEKTIKIGGLYTMSGSYADFLQGAQDGVRLAVEDYQKQAGTKVQLVEEDDKSCADKTSGANKLINVDQVSAIVGTTCSSMTLAIAPIAEQSKTIVISGVSTSADVTKAGEYVFRTISSDASKSEKVASEIKKNGYNRVATVYDNTNDASSTNIRDLVSLLKDSDAKVVVNEPVTAELDYRTTLLKIKEANPDVLVISFTDPQQYAQFMKQYDEMKIPRVPTYVPLETIEQADVITLGGAHVEGILYPYFAEPSGQKYDAFKAEYKARYGKDVPAYAAESYDATMITLKAIAASDGTHEDAQRKMFIVGNNYDGVSGVVTFDANGDVTKPLVMKTIKDGKFVVLE